VATVRSALGEASFIVVAITLAVAIPTIVTLVAVNRRISSIRLDDEMDDDSGEFRGGYLTKWMRCPYGRLQGKLLDRMDEMSVQDGFRGRNFLPLQYIISTELTTMVS
jgi:hypothetical protein